MSIYIICNKTSFHLRIYIYIYLRQAVMKELEGKNVMKYRVVMADKLMQNRMT